MGKFRWIDEYCNVCGKRLNTWDARCSKALGYRHKVCESCIAKEYDRSIDEFRSVMEHHFGIRTYHFATSEKFIEAREIDIDLCIYPFLNIETRIVIFHIFSIY